MPTSSHLASTAVTMMAASSIHGTGPQKRLSRRRRGETCFSGTSFQPAVLLIRVTSADDKPAVLLLLLLLLVFRAILNQKFST